MPCYDGRDNLSDRIADCYRKIDDLTDLLCTACSLIPPEVMKPHTKLVGWKICHEAEDKRKKQQEVADKKSRERYIKEEIAKLQKQLQD
jgi:hypothetical protein